jgi:tetratricopeptide (TPR) repeat protein
VVERLSRISPALRAFLTVAAVDGETFSLNAVQKALMSRGYEIPRNTIEDLSTIHDLIQPENVRHHEGTVLSSFRFRHILFQRYLYQRADVAERFEIHSFLGEAWESLYAGDRSVIALNLARHFQEGGRPEKAWQYWSLAAERARDLGAFRESARHLEAALGALGQLDPGPDRDRRELEIQLDLAFCRAEGALEGHAEACRRALDLAQAVGTDEQLFGALAQEYWTFCHYAGRNRRGRKLAERVLALARGLGDPGILLHSLEVAGCSAHQTGDFPTALLRYHEMAAVYEPGLPVHPRYTTALDPAISSTTNIGWSLWFLGFPDKGLELCRRAVESARGLRSSKSYLLAKLFLGLVLTWRRDLEAARQELENLGARAREQGVDLYFDPYILTYVGWCRAREGDVALGIRMLEEGLERQRRSGFKVWTPHMNSLLADALRLHGRPEEGLELWEESHEGVEEREDLAHEPEALRIKGDLLLALPAPKPEDAEGAFRKAIRVARRQASRSYELRASVSLGRLLRDTGRPEEGRALIADVYDRFTEGFDAPDLREAAEFLSKRRGKSGEPV